jgi:hypothetical protein
MLMRYSWMHFQARKSNGGWRHSAKTVSRTQDRGDLIQFEYHSVDFSRRKVARIVLHLDPEHEPRRARRAFESHLSRAKWMTEHGYRHLLRGGASA